MKFNPYKDARDDYAAQRRATHKHWKRWCCKCNTEKPIKGGRVVGNAFIPGLIPRFTCADCLPKEEAEHG